jgi:hypothetical protein
MAGVDPSLAKGICLPAFSRRMAGGLLWLVGLHSDVINLGVQKVKFFSLCVCGEGKDIARFFMAGPTGDLSGSVLRGTQLRRVGLPGNRKSEIGNLKLKTG